MGSGVSERTVVDTGPLVAIVRTREAAHGRCVAALGSLRAPLLTCWPVLTEVAWLLRAEPGGMRVIGELVRGGAVEIVELDEIALAWIVAYLDRYTSLGAQLADAALMYIAERRGIGTVFTLDRRDFSVYRTTDGRALDIVPDA